MGTQNRIRLKSSVSGAGRRCPWPVHVALSIVWPCHVCTLFTDCQGGNLSACRVRQANGLHAGHTQWTSKPMRDRTNHAAGPEAGPVKALRRALKPTAHQLGAGGTRQNLEVSVHKQASVRKTARLQAGRPEYTLDGATDRHMHWSARALYEKVCCRP
eukprot:229477-Chlamydomonas_euryale.AAC.7